MCVLHLVSGWFKFYGLTLRLIKERDALATLEFVKLLLGRREINESLWNKGFFFNSYSLFGPSGKNAEFFRNHLFPLFCKIRCELLEKFALKVFEAMNFLDLFCLSHSFSHSYFTQQQLGFFLYSIKIVFTNFHLFFNTILHFNFCGSFLYSFFHYSTFSNSMSFLG